MVNREELRQLCREVNLVYLAEVPTFDVDIEDKVEYLKYMLEIEDRGRKQGKEEKYHKVSNLPKRVEPRTFSGVNEWNVNEAMSLRWVKANQNLLIIGKCGTGKTALAVQIANEAIRQEHRVYYIKLDELLNALDSKSLSRSRRILAQAKEAEIVIIDEMMYIPLTREELIMLYREVMFLSEARSMIFITNRAISDWDELIKDKHVLETFKDRILKNSRQIVLN